MAVDILFMYLGAHIYISGTDPSLLRKRRKSAFHKQAEPAYYNYRGSRWYLPDEYSSISTISLSPEPLPVALHLVFFFYCVLPLPSYLLFSLPFRIYIGAVERLRPQVRLYITEHVPARDMLHAVRPDLESRAKDAEGESVARRRSSTSKREKRGERENAGEDICVCTYMCSTFPKRHTSHKTFRERVVIEFGKRCIPTRHTRFRRFWNFFTMALPKFY